MQLCGRFFAGRFPFLLVCFSKYFSKKHLHICISAYPKGEPQTQPCILCSICIYLPKCKLKLIILKIKVGKQYKTTAHCRNARLPPLREPSLRLPAALLQRLLPLRPHLRRPGYFPPQQRSGGGSSGDAWYLQPKILKVLPLDRIFKLSKYINNSLAQLADLGLGGGVLVGCCSM